MNVFAKRLRVHRTLRGMTQRELGTACGVSGAAITNLEKGHSAPSARLLECVCMHFNLRPDYLMGWTPVAHPRKGMERPTTSIFPLQRSGR